MKKLIQLLKREKEIAIGIIALITIMATIIAREVVISNDCTAHGGVYANDVCYAKGITVELP